MIIDVHGHVGHWSFPVTEMSSQDLVSQMDRYGIDITFVSSSLAVRYDFKAGNAQLAKDLKKHPRLKGYVTVNLNYPDESIHEITHYMGSNFMGVKIHPMLSRRRLDSLAGLKIAEAIARMDVPILIHTYGSELETPKQVLEVVKHFPQIKIILAHTGGFDWHLGMDIAGASDTIYAELCSSCTSADKVLQLIKAFGKERVLFGTDTTLFHPGYALGMVADAHLDAQTLRFVMGINVQKIFQLS